MSEEHATATVQHAAPVEGKRLEGIEGWLVLPMLYLLSVAFFTAGSLLYTELPWARPELLAGNVACLVGAVVLLTLFLKKLAIVPPLMIVFYVVVACGGMFDGPGGQSDFLTPYLSYVLGSIGLKSVEVLRLELLTRGAEPLARAQAKAAAWIEERVAV